MGRSRLYRWLPLALTALLPALPLRADAPPGTTYLELKEGRLSYTIVHKLHEATGVCSVVEGRIALLPNGDARVQVRAKVACFDSGNANRDVHMREATHEALHPYASVKGTVTGLKLPLAGKTELKLDARVELNGEAQQLVIPITLEPDGARIKGSFKSGASLDLFKVERPELLFVKIDDTVQLEGELKFEPVQAGAPAAQ